MTKLAFLQDYLDGDDGRDFLRGRENDDTLYGELFYRSERIYFYFSDFL